MADFFFSVIIMPLFGGLLCLNGAICIGALIKHRKPETTTFERGTLKTLNNDEMINKYHKLFFLSAMLLGASTLIIFIQLAIIT